MLEKKLVSLPITPVLQHWYLSYIHVTLSPTLTEARSLYSLLALCGIKFELWSPLGEVGEFSTSISLAKVQIVSNEVEVLLNKVLLRPQAILILFTATYNYWGFQGGRIRVTGK